MLLSSILLIGDNIRRIAAINAILVTLDPNTSPRVIPMFPEVAEKIETVVSGNDVEIATITNPDDNSLIPTIFENFEIEFTA